MGKVYIGTIIIPQKSGQIKKSCVETLQVVLLSTTTLQMVLLSTATLQMVLLSTATLQMVLLSTATRKHYKWYCSQLQQENITNGTALNCSKKTLSVRRTKELGAGKSMKFSQSKRNSLTEFFQGASTNNSCC